MFQTKLQLGKLTQIYETGPSENNNEDDINQMKYLSNVYVCMYVCMKNTELKT